MSWLSRREFSTLLAATVTGSAIAAPNASPPRGGTPARNSASGFRAGEVRSLRRFVEHTSPRGLEAAADPRWRALCDEAERSADTAGDGRYIVNLRRLLGWFGEGHTTVVPFEFLGTVPAPLAGGVWGLNLPLRARPFHDGLLVIEAGGEAEPLLGARIERIGGAPVDRVVAAHVRSWPGENPAWGHNWSGTLLSTPGLLHGLGILSGPSDAPVSVDALRPDGSRASINLTPRTGPDLPRVKVARAAGWPEQLRLSGNGSGNFVAPIRDRGALYLSIDDMADAEQIPFAKLTAELLELSRQDAFRRVVIDLRRNGGGDNYAGEALRRELARSRFNCPGGLYVLIGPATFSAAQNFANRLERETFAIFVGEPTGSAPNLVGDPKFFVGEATGLTAMVATLRWSDGGPDDRRQWIFPDLLVPANSADWLAGRDRALQVALADVPAASDDFAARTRYFERPSQQQAWTPFWKSA